MIERDYSMVGPMPKDVTPMSIERFDFGAREVNVTPTFLVMSVTDQDGDDYRLLFQIKDIMKLREILDDAVAQFPELLKG